VSILKRVAVLGGGMGGLTVAHELSRRGFEVSVYEQEETPGGKSKSRTVEGTGTQGRRDLPSEHGFRFFPGFYQHLPDVMSQIKMPGGKTCADFLTPTSSVLLTRFGQSGLELPTNIPSSLSEFFKAVTSVLKSHLGLKNGEAVFFMEKLLQVCTSCADRRLDELETVSWWDFIEADSQSEAYQHILGEGLSRSLVAARAKEASARTIGQVQVHLMSHILLGGASTDRILQGPTSEVFLNPWVEQLVQSGVKFVCGSQVEALELHDGKIGGASIRNVNTGAVTSIEADWFVVCLPVECTAPLVNQDMISVDPSLSSIQELAGYTRWMTGGQFYLSDEVNLNHGHTLHVDTPWALTSISQLQFWPSIQSIELGNGDVKTILSVVISDWDKIGFNGKTATEAASRQEIFKEVWQQLKTSLNVDGQVILRDEAIVNQYLDIAVKLASESPVGKATNREPLFINRPNSWFLRPKVTTKIPNLLLASDYVQTQADLACMECACEAGRRAVNALLSKSGSAQAFCRTYPLDMPFKPLRIADKVAFDLGIDWVKREVEQ
jgi:uncharacterized protein with NAD-binding domain and iron-sulfur cluster